MCQPRSKALCVVAKRVTQATRPGRAAPRRRCQCAAKDPHDKHTASSFTSPRAPSLVIMRLAKSPHIRQGLGGLKPCQRRRRPTAKTTYNARGDSRRRGKADDCLPQAKAYQSPILPPPAYTTPPKPPKPWHSAHASQNPSRRPHRADQVLPESSQPESTISGTLRIDEICLSPLSGDFSGGPGYSNVRVAPPYTTLVPVIPP